MTTTIHSGMILFTRREEIKPAWWKKTKHEEYQAAYRRDQILCIEQTEEPGVCWVETENDSFYAIGEFVELMLPFGLSPSPEKKYLYRCRHCNHRQNHAMLCDNCRCSSMALA